MHEPPPPEKVGKGDTLYAISRRTGVPVDDLAELNKLKKPYHVRLGQSLKLPKTRAYTVHSGDTLSGVAARFGVDTDVLAAFNSFSAKTPIRAGQKIDLPPNAEDKAAKIKPKPAPAPASDVAITNRDRVIFPESGQTKGEMADYYARIAPLMLPVAGVSSCDAGRPPERSPGAGI